MSVLKQRIITAIILIPAVILATCTLNMYWFAAFTGIFICFGAWEWSALSGYKNRSTRAFFVLLFPAGVSGCLYYMDTVVPLIIITIAVLWWLLPSIYLILEFGKKTSSILDSSLVKAGMGIPILIPAWLSFILLREQWNDGVMLLLFLMVMIWIADTAAYFTGRRWGRTRLCPQISPGKTWEGVYGALLATSIFALSSAWYFNMQAIETLIFLVICIVTSTISIAGDLMVSLIKRKAQVKDSGSLLPGHGGIMDRIDSLTAAGPVFLAGIWLVRGV